MSAFDQLPRPVRDRLNDALFRFSPVWILGVYRNGRSVEWIISGLANAEERMQSQ